jgi:acyl-CoA reductase-like NAD-dependent aldehyde dehydrogenase
MSQTFSTINPFTEAVLQLYTFQTDAEVDRVLDRASHAYRSWKSASLATRSYYIRAVREKLLSERQPLAT